MTAGKEFRAHFVRLLEQAQREGRTNAVAADKAIMDATEAALDRLESRIESLAKLRAGGT